MTINVENYEDIKLLSVATKVISGSDDDEEEAKAEKQQGEHEPKSLISNDTHFQSLSLQGDFAYLKRH